MRCSALVLASSSLDICSVGEISICALNVGSLAWWLDNA
jgi:hypothetical protein